jgi:hypothetical protein
VGQGGFDDPKWRVDVGLHRRVEIVRRDISDRFPRLLASSVTDEDVKAAELAHRVFDQLLAKVFLPEIAGNGDRFSAGFFD